MVKKKLENISSDTLIRKIQEVCDSFQLVKFQHVTREGNKVADWLGRSCPYSNSELDNIEIPNLQVKRLLLKDKLEVTYVKVS